MEEGPEEDSEVERGKEEASQVFSFSHSGGTLGQRQVFGLLCCFVLVWGALGQRMNCFRHTESETMVN